MTATDFVFAGSIPALYERHLGPLLFAPYAADLAARAAALAPKRILETAAGTGIVTAALAAALPAAEITATDLNQAMLDVAAGALSGIDFRQADAQALPFADAAFDLVVSQFGVMFFPDRIGAYAEARRVLRPGGAFLFNAWDRLERNPVTAAIGDALARHFPNDPPNFYARIPFGYHDPARIEADLRAADFTEIAIETVALSSRVDARAAATGLCQGTPLRAEIEQRGDLAEATVIAMAALAPFDGKDAPMSALVATAR
jgi:ubiquinone/menaquinone biosynthesis C-methylase UbiE